MTTATELREVSASQMARILGMNKVMVISFLERGDIPQAWRNETPGGRTKWRVPLWAIKEWQAKRGEQ